MSNKEKIILILGGNGFIGAESVANLLSTYGDEYKLILLNRGNWSDWDLSTRIKPHIHENIIFDRQKGNDHELKAVLDKYLVQPLFKFEAIIDFSGFKTKEVSMISIYSVLLTCCYKKSKFLSINYFS